MATDYLNGFGVAFLLGISQSLVRYRRQIIGLEADAYVTGADGKRSEVFTHESALDFASRWETHAATSRRYRSDLAAWKLSKPEYPAKAEELVARQHEEMSPTRRRLIALAAS
jgi:hypothetical protein